MAGFNLLPSKGIAFLALAILQGTGGSPSIDLLFGSRSANQSTTQNPSISERVHATLNNVLRIPLPLFGAPPVVVSGGNGAPAVVAVVQNPNQQQAYSEGAPPGFLPDVNEAIHSTIQQLSTLSHWPFPYETPINSQNAQPTVPTPPTSTVAKTAPPQTTTRRTTTTTTTTTTTPAPTTTPPPPPPPPPPSTAVPLPPLPQFVLSQSQPSSLIFTIGQGSPGGPLHATQSLQFTPGAPSPSLSDRIHNRIQSTLGNLRLPNLSQIGQPRPLPRITEPPWVTELLGPTLEPPTTRMPTLGERVQNAVSNVLLFVPAALANFWYENWGTQQVDRIVQQIQAAATPKPGSPAEPVFATISAKDPNNPFKNLTVETLNNPAELPAIAAFINNNGTLQPTIVHPVVNMTANTIEYHLRGVNETTVLWTGMLSNDIFFGNRKRRPGFEETPGQEDDEDDSIQSNTLNM